MPIESKPTWYRNEPCMVPSGPEVKLIVGPKREKLRTHLNIISRHSTVFRNAFSGPWKEAATMTFELPETDPEVVRTFLCWAYHQYCLGPTYALELYVLAVHYEIPLLQIDATVTLFLHWTTYDKTTKSRKPNLENLPGAEIIDFLLDSLPEDNLLLSLLCTILSNFVTWEYQWSKCEDWEATKAARLRLFNTVPVQDVKIKAAHEYYLDAKLEEGYGCPNTWTCFNCIWLARKKPWLFVN